MTAADSAIDVTQVAPLGHAEALELQSAELDRAVAMLESLDSDEWAAQTDCPDWDVRDMYLHVLGACEAGARMRENVHQLRRAVGRRRSNGGPLEAAISSVQVEERSELLPADIVRELRAVAPKTVRGRARIPGVIRELVKIPVDGPVEEKWSLTYLTGTIYLRDLWMHRIDASRAVHREPVLTADHDGRIIADIVREWAGRHRQPFELELSGPAGARYRHLGGDGGGEPIVMDAVEFCRTLAGREAGTGLLATVVPF